MELWGRNGNFVIDRTRDSLQTHALPLEETLFLANQPAHRALAFTTPEMHLMHADPLRP